MELLDLLYIGLTALGFLVAFLFVRRWLKPGDGGQPHSPGANSAVEQGRAEAYVLGRNGQGGFGGDGGAGF